MKKLYVFCIKSLLCIILFFIIAIMCKSNVELKNSIRKIVYNESISFSYFKSFYNKYLGGIFPIDNISTNDFLQVFNDDLLYSEVNSYKDGAKLLVSFNYLVPSINEGTVVYVGEKEFYGNVIIVEGDDGVNVWYGNMCNVNVNLYDSLGIGSYLGEVCDNKLYLVFSKKNKYLNYSEYIK